MPKMKVLGGKDIVEILSKFDFRIVDQTGSHVKLRRITKTNEKQTLIVPLHKEIDKGLLNAIFKQAKVHIGEELKKYFFS